MILPAFFGWIGRSSLRSYIRLTTVRRRDHIIKKLIWKIASCYDMYKKLPATCTEGVERNTKKPVGVSTRPGAEPPPWGIHPQAYDSTRARAPHRNTRPSSLPIQFTPWKVITAYHSDFLSQFSDSNFWKTTACANSYPRLSTSNFLQQQHRHL